MKKHTRRAILFNIFFLFAIESAAGFIPWTAPRILIVGAIAGIYAIASFYCGQIAERRDLRPSLDKLAKVVDEVGDLAGVPRQKPNA